MNVTLSELAGWCGGRVVPAGAGDLVVHGVSTDSRTVKEGELFVAIDGLNQDGHQFVRFAVAAGAVAAVVEKTPRDAGNLPLMHVDDSLEAVGRMANGYRWHPPLIPWIAVTGSNGKTTTRQILSLILASRWKVRLSRRNWNNLIGLPLSMLGPPDDAGVAVMEMASVRPGEIARLREICVPTIGVVTSTGQYRYGGFDSAEAAAREKADVFGWLPPDGLAIYPADDPHAGILRGAVVHRAASFSIHSDVRADLTARDIESAADGSRFTVDGDVRVSLPLPGRHNIGNCLAAMLAARHLGVGYAEAAQAILNARPASGRLQIVRTPARITVVNDSYKSNPDAILAALETFTDFPDGRKIAVLGDMADLGPDSRRWHREIGLTVGMMDLDALFMTGPETAAMAEAAQVNARIVVRHFPSIEALWAALATFLKPGDQILVKGPRGMSMERMVNQLLEWFP